MVASAAAAIFDFFNERGMWLLPVLASSGAITEQRVGAAMFDALGHVILRQEPLALLRNILTRNLMGEEDPAPQIARRSRGSDAVDLNIELTGR